MSSFQNVHNALASLDIPREYTQMYEDGSPDIAAVSSLERWHEQTLQNLRTIHNLMQESQSDWSTKEQAEAIFSLSRLTGDDSWNTETIRQQSQDMLGSINSKHTLDVVKIILQDHLKPIFRSNPHPLLNTTTGRKLPRPAGGTLATHDFYAEQTWKETVGIHNIVLWCIRHLNTDAYEQLWPFIIPPVMTMLDDYQPPYKLKGVQVVQAILQNVPSSLLRRTGIDTLLRTSLATCFTSLRDRDSPGIISAGVESTLALVKLTTNVGSIEYFEQLCELLGDGIIGTVWRYGFNDRDCILSSILVLPKVLTSLGLGCARYLKALVRQLIHPLLPDECGHSPQELQIASLHALDVVIDVCKPRIQFWKGHILRGVCSGWVYSVQSGQEELSKCLHFTCNTLVLACPSVKEDFDRLMEIDQTMFESLVSGHDEVVEPEAPLSGESEGVNGMK